MPNILMFKTNISNFRQSSNQIALFVAILLTSELVGSVLLVREQLLDRHSRSLVKGKDDNIAQLL